jgi:hypothetical protein
LTPLGACREIESPDEIRVEAGHAPDSARARCGAVLRVPAEGSAEVFFEWAAFRTPRDLRGAVITFEVENLGALGSVRAKAYLRTGGLPLKWADGGEFLVESGLTKLVTVIPRCTAWQEPGYDPTRTMRLGLSLKAVPDPAGESGTVPVFVRNVRIDAWQ